jgi:hypothetical protein
MKKYQVPNVKSASSETTKDDDASKVQVEIEVEFFDVLYTKHLH